jgi:hypothetical protein
MASAKERAADNPDSINSAALSEIRWRREVLNRKPIRRVRALLSSKWTVSRRSAAELPIGRILRYKPGIVLVFLNS